jgi:hypothetical protein
MNTTKADNIASIYGLKERKRLAAVAQSNTLIGVAVAASKLHAQQERKRLAAVHTRNAQLLAETEDLALKVACRASTTATILFVFCIVVLLLYTICSVVKNCNM